jgi:hypothetical protein
VADDSIVVKIIIISRFNFFLGQDLNPGYITFSASVLLLQHLDSAAKSKSARNQDLGISKNFSLEIAYNSLEQNVFIAYGFPHR